MATIAKKRGGARPGAGRPTGWRKLTQVTARVESLLASGKKDTPLEVMLEYMWTLKEHGNLKDAAEIAHRCAPFIHSKMASVNTDESSGESITVNVVKFGDLATDAPEELEESEETE